MKKEKDKIEVLLDEIKRLNEVNHSPRNVITKGLLNGIFTSIGATFGFALVVFLLGGLFRFVDGVPILSDFYEDSGLKKIVQHQLEQIQEEENQDVNGVSTGSGSEVVDEEYMPPSRF